MVLNRGDVLTPATASQPARLRVEGKGPLREERIIYLSSGAYAVVARWLALMPGKPDGPLCPNARGKRLTVNGVQERQKILGHVDLNTTQRYARVADPIVEQDYQQAMMKIEQQAHALTLAPIPFDAFLAASRASIPRPCVTEPLDNSM